MRVICTTHACMHAINESNIFYILHTGFLSAPSQLIGSGPTPRLETLSSAAIRLLQCDCSVWGTSGSDALCRYEAAGRVRAAPAERRAQTAKPELPTSLPRRLDGDGARLSNGTGRDDIYNNTFSPPFVFFTAMTWGAAAAGDFASREGDADKCITSLKRRETPACHHGDNETLPTCCRRVHEWQEHHCCCAFPYRTYNHQGTFAESLFPLSTVIIFTAQRSSERTPSQSDPPAPPVPNVTGQVQKWSWHSNLHFFLKMLKMLYYRSCTWQHWINARVFKVAQK